VSRCVTASTAEPGSAGDFTSARTAATCWPLTRWPLSRIVHPVVQTGSDEWQRRHQEGMVAAASKTAAHRLSGETLAAIRRTTRERNPCKVKGCKRTAYKGSICRAHWQLVPHADVIAMQIECMTAQRMIAAKHHRRFLRKVQILAKAGA
jgi:predicted lipase